MILLFACFKASSCCSNKTDISAVCFGILTQDEKRTKLEKNSIFTIVRLIKSPIYIFKNLILHILYITKSMPNKLHIKKNLSFCNNISLTDDIV